MNPRAAQLRARTKSVDETRALAGTVAGLVEPSDLILLSGELGTGKTAFVQGFGQALGVEGPITSPTFALAQRYEGKLVVHHLDVYRLDQLHEVYDLGVAELLDEGGVVLIEWGDAVAPALPSGHLEVHLAYVDDPDHRELSFTLGGQAWARRLLELQASIAQWADSGDAPGARGEDGSAC